MRASHSRGVNVAEERVPEEYVESVEKIRVKIQVLICVVTNGDIGAQDRHRIDECDV